MDLGQRVEQADWQLASARVFQRTRAFEGFDQAAQTVTLCIQVADSLLQLDLNLRQRNLDHQLSRCRQFLESHLRRLLAFTVATLGHVGVDDAQTCLLGDGLHVVFVAVKRAFQVPDVLIGHA
ncbi:hypothetical protein D3C84_528320 [compost metagenome]